ncbi:uncharacterized protein F4812DRAFT_423147 [Daldinia caldariorum]|uniref:uncharacterized protein n=1 Tax=Daldinia caldariorum TaxID=326644 RepID=UPI002008E883|nr:uncharacterized protein F4812DRAFT_423147 [Daldinia caldariorum]KAI1469456.1 hypothetical protein F4812DRAFT_423147 [Daldinia caldariorum]
MGGIVAAETAIGIASEVPVPHTTATSKAGRRDSLTVLVDESLGPTGLMFPYIQGVLAFDTPFLGISPGVVAHGAEGHYNSVNGALAQLSGLSTIFWNNYNQAAGNTNTGTGGSSNKKPAGALPAPETPTPPEKKKQQSTGGWGWGQIAMVAGAAGALAAGGAAAYMNREHLSSGWSWVSSHLEFVGCLARGAELRERLAKMVKLDRQMGVGFANLYTRLGKAASAKEVSMVGTVVGTDRTFCNLPEKDKRTTGLWMEAINDKSKDEIGAHMAMFEPKDNPGYRKLSEDAKNLIVRWSRNEWYESSGRRRIQ